VATVSAPTPEPEAVRPLTVAVAVPLGEADEACCDDVAPAGGAGGVVGLAGVTAFDALDAAPVPTLLVAVTAKV
jgi:hypothetical protein